jgi:hypothetical protein
VSALSGTCLESGTACGAESVLEDAGAASTSASVAMIDPEILFMVWLLAPSLAKGKIVLALFDGRQTG